MRRHSRVSSCETDSAKGFTLLEVLVAFIIAALALGVVVQTSATAVRTTRVAGRTDEAVARAASHLAILSAVPLIDSDRQGDEGGGYHWHVRIASDGTVNTPAARPEDQSYAVTLYRVVVTISWTENGQSRLVRLQSSRLGPLT